MFFSWGTTSSLPSMSIPTVVLILTFLKHCPHKTGASEQTPRRALPLGTSKYRCCHYIPWWNHRTPKTYFWYKIRTLHLHASSQMYTQAHLKGQLPHFQSFHLGFAQVWGNPMPSSRAETWLRINQTLMILGAGKGNKTIKMSGNLFERGYFVINLHQQKGILVP